jgi:salicylate 5-hydroxylase large subunit
MNNIGRVWPNDAAGKVPYWVYSDPDVYAAELERIWYGPHWLFCALEAEIPEVGDFKTTTLGERPVIVVCSGPDEVSVLENRCAHPGGKVLPGAQGTCEGPSVPLSPMELQPSR